MGAALLERRPFATQPLRSTRQEILCAVVALILPDPMEFPTGLNVAVGSQGADF